MFRTAITTAIVYLMVMGPALAQQVGRGRGPMPPAPPRNPVRQVPEIDASAGLLALAAVATVLLLLWERNRRKDKSADLPS